jgi:hypothetical protein
MVWGDIEEARFSWKQNNFEENSFKERKLTEF